MVGGRGGGVGGGLTCGMKKKPLQNFALKMQGEFMHEGIFAGHYGKYNILSYCIMYILL